MWPFGRRPAKKPGKKYTCSFCGKNQDEVRKLIAGPIVYICDECIDLCNDIIAEEVEQEEQLKGAASPVASLSTPTWCRVCHLPKSAEEIVAVSELGFFCRRCIDMICAAIDDPAPG